MRGSVSEVRCTLREHQLQDNKRKMETAVTKKKTAGVVFKS